MEQALTCKLCLATSHLKLDVKEYVQHIRLFHAHIPDFKITCGIEGCQRTFANFGTFRNHVYDIHTESTTEPSELDILNTESQECDNAYAIDNDDYSSHGDEQDYQDYTELDNCESQTCFSQPMLQEFSAIFLLGLRKSIN